MADSVDYCSLEGGRKSPPTEEGIFFKEIRNAFVRKVFGIVAAQLLTTSLVSLLLFNIPGGTEWARQSSGPVIALASSWLVAGEFCVYNFLGIVLMSSLALLCFGRRIVYPYNYLLLLAFTLSESLIVGCVVCFYTAPSVVLCLGCCCGISAGLCIFSLQTKHDLSSLRGVLFVLGLNVFFIGIIAIFVDGWVRVLYYALALVLFSVYLAVDVHLIAGRGQYRLEEDDFIQASIMLYIDILNIFISLLRLFGQRDD